MVAIASQHRRRRVTARAVMLWAAVAAVSAAKRRSGDLAAAETAVEPGSAMSKQSEAAATEQRRVKMHALLTKVEGSLDYEH